MATRIRRRESGSAEQRGLKELAGFAIHWIRLVGLALLATVVYLELRNAPLDGFARTFDNTSLIKIGLVIFFFGWAWGATDDTKIMKKGYRRDPKLGKIGHVERAGIVVFSALFVSIFFIPNRPVWFQLNLFALIVVNAWTWRVIFNRTVPVIKASYEECAAARDIRVLAKLLLVVEYMNGSWQRKRFRALIILAAIQIPVVFLVEAGLLSPLGAGLTINGVPATTLIGYLPGALFILYVLISEIWMKVYRVRVYSDLQTVDWLEEHFTLSKQRDRPLPEPHLGGAFDFSPPTNPNYVGYGPLRWMTETD
jgi:hypothetical protein